MQQATILDWCCPNMRSKLGFKTSSIRLKTSFSRSCTAENADTASRRPAQIDVALERISLLAAMRKLLSKLAFASSLWSCKEGGQWVHDSQSWNLDLWLPISLNLWVEDQRTEAVKCSSYVLFSSCERELSVLIGGVWRRIYVSAWI